MPGALVAALVALLNLRDTQTGIYSAVALNDDLSFYARLVLLVRRRWSCWRWRIDEPADDRAGEFFGALLMINAGAMLVAAANELVFLFVGPRAGEHADLPAALSLAPQPGDAGGRDQVFLPEHLLLGPAPLRPGVPVRHDRGQQPEGAGVPVRQAGRTCRSSSSA